MADTANLFLGGRDKGAKATAPNSQDFTTGILPSQTIHLLIGAGDIQSDTPILDGQIQPASIDLRLGNVAYRVRGSFLPGPHATVRGRLETFTMHQIDLTEGAVLEKGCVYLVPLQERLSLKKDISGMANPLSLIHI